MMHPFTDVAIEYIIRFLSQTKMSFCRVSVFKIIVFHTYLELRSCGFLFNKHTYLCSGL